LDSGDCYNKGVFMVESIGFASGSGGGWGKGVTYNFLAWTLLDDDGAIYVDGVVYGKKKNRFFRPRCIGKGMSKTSTFPAWAAKNIGVLVSWARSRFEENIGLGERFFTDLGKPREYLTTSSKELVKRKNIKILKIFLITALKEKVLPKF